MRANASGATIRGDTPTVVSATTRSDVGRIFSRSWLWRLWTRTIVAADDARRPSGEVRRLGAARSPALAAPANHATSGTSRFCNCAPRLPAMKLIPRLRLLVLSDG